MAVVPNFGAANTSATTTTSNTVWSDAVSYTFAAADQVASSVYALLWGGAFGADTNSSDYKVQVLEDANVKASLSIEPREIVSPVDRDQLAGIAFITAASTPVDKALNVQIESEVFGTTTTAHNAMLRLLKLPTGSVYAESAAQQNYTSQASFADKTGASITVSTSTEYFFIVTAEVQNRDITGFAGEVGLNINGSIVNSLPCGTSDIDTWAQCLVVYKGTPAGTTAKVQCRQTTSDSAQLRIRNVSILAVPTGAFRNVYYQQLASNSDGPEPTYTTALTMTQTVAAGDHLVIAPLQLHSGSNSRSAYCRLTSGGSQVDEHIREPGSSTPPLGAPSGGFFRLESYSAGSRTWTLDRKSETSDTTRLNAGSSILVIDLEAAGGGGNVYNDNYNETVAAADSLATTATFLTGLSEGAAAAVSESSAATFPNSVSESAAANAAQAAAAVFGSTLSEAAAAGDGSASAAAFANNLAEAVTAGDSASSIAVFASALSEAATPTVAQTIDGTTYNETLAEAATPAMAITAAQTFLAAVSEGAMPTDQASSNAAMNSALSESAIPAAAYNDNAPTPPTPSDRIVTPRAVSRVVGASFSNRTVSVGRQRGRTVIAA